MPSTLSYPGVYIEEISSGVRTISGVATSIAAFVGWAAQGPTDRAALVQSWTDFQRVFGGLDRRSLLPYAVQHFFNNGGQQAYIVRLAHTDAKTASLDIAAPDATTLTVSGQSPGAWANALAPSVMARTDQPQRFRFTVLQTVNGKQTPVESFENLSMDPADRRFVGTIINHLSQYIRVTVSGAGVKAPANTGTPAPPLTGGLDGTVLAPDDANFEAALLPGSGSGGVNLLARVDLFNLLAVPGETTPAQIALLQKFCRDHRAFLLVDSDPGATFATLSTNGPDAAITGDDAINAALYFPWVNAPDPLQDGGSRRFPPCGFLAGLYAKTDANRGVWKAPAGTEASLTGATGLAEVLTDLENGTLNNQAVNCLRFFNVYGNVVWGARTLQGNSERGSEWKYVPVRRMALFIEESLYRGTQWVVFEPNDEPLWAQIRLNVGAFMQGLFRQGALQGKSPQEAYFVKCDGETTTLTDVNLGVVNIQVGFAPLRPAEFVVIQIQQMISAAV